MPNMGIHSWPPLMPWKKPWPMLSLGWQVVPSCLLRLTSTKTRMMAPFSLEKSHLSCVFSPFVPFLFSKDVLLLPPLCSCRRQVLRTSLLPLEPGEGSEENC